MNVSDQIKTFLAPMMTQPGQPTVVRSFAVDGRPVDPMNSFRYVGEAVWYPYSPEVNAILSRGNGVFFGKYIGGNPCYFLVIPPFNVNESTQQWGSISHSTGYQLRIHYFEWTGVGEVSELALIDNPVAFDIFDSSFGNFFNRTFEHAYYDSLDSSISLTFMIGGWKITIPGGAMFIRRVQ